MNAIQNAKPLGPDEMPDREPRRPGLTKDAVLVSDLLKLLLKIRAKESGVAAKTDRPLGRPRGACRGRPQEPQNPVRLALRAIRQGRARPRRRPARLRDRERQAQDEPRCGQGDGGCVGSRLLPRILGLLVSLRRRSRPVRDAAADPGSWRDAGPQMRSDGTEKYIGQTGTSETGAAIQQATNAAVLRWAPPNTMLTMDYREDRVTVWLDAANKITKIAAARPLRRSSSIRSSARRIVGSDSRARSAIAWRSTASTARSAVQ